MDSARKIKLTGFGIDKVRRIDPTLAKLWVAGFVTNFFESAAAKSALKEVVDGNAVAKEAEVNGGGSSAGK